MKGEKWIVKKLITLKIVIVPIPPAPEKEFAVTVLVIISACVNYLPAPFQMMPNQPMIARLSILHSL